MSRPMVILLICVLSRAAFGQTAILESRKWVSPPTPLQGRFPGLSLPEGNRFTYDKTYTYIAILFNETDGCGEIAREVDGHCEARIVVSNAPRIICHESVEAQNTVICEWKKPKPPAESGGAR